MLFCYFRENLASSLRCMPSHFHLLQAVDSALHHGSLEGIDALLGNGLCTYYHMMCLPTVDFSHYHVLVHIYIYMQSFFNKSLTLKIA